MKKLMNGVLFLALVGMFFIGCKQDDSQFEMSNQSQSEILQKNKSSLNKNAGNPITLGNTINNISIIYTGQIVGNDLLINIEINDGNTQKSLNESITVEANRESISNNVPGIITEIQQRLSSDFTFQEITDISLAMNEMVGNNITILDDYSLGDLRVQGLLICKSMVKSIRRQVYFENQDPGYAEGYLLLNTSNSTIEGFKREMTSFSLSEDAILNVSDIINAVQSDLQVAIDKGADFFPTMLDNYQHANITFYDLERMILAFTADNPSGFEGPTSPVGLSWPRGSDHGCCGNYSGPCYFWHPYCWVHDKLCSDCGWGCFSGCVPD